MNLLPLLTTYAYSDKIRLGNRSDGGYVVADLRGLYDGYISAGIGDDASFCAAFIEKYDTQNNYAFDGTINKLPKNFPNKLKFIRKNIGTDLNDSETDLAELLSQGKNLFLKMDIEGGEVAWLNKVSLQQLMNIKQLVIEMHGITDDSWGNTLMAKIAGLEKLTQNHRIVHVHGNNCGPMSEYEGVRIPAVVELTLVRVSELAESEERNTQLLPIYNIDFPNNSDLADYDMNYPPFVFSKNYEAFER